MTITTLTTTSWRDELRDWHQRRLAETTADHGIAALVSNTWLTAQPAPVPGLPGVWSARDGVARGEAGAWSYFLAGGESQLFGVKRARVIAQRSSLALRVFDPEALSRTSVADIAGFPPEESWRLIGRFEPADPGSRRLIEHFDGARTDDAVAGVVRVEVAGHSAALLAFPVADGRLQVTFADRTNGRTTAQFRFLSLPRPEADGSILVDFNRAYLPNCAFSDHYLCALPPQQNRLPVEVTAGETFVKRFPL